MTEKLVHPAQIRDYLVICCTLFYLEASSIPCCATLSVRQRVLAAVTVNFAFSNQIAEGCLEVFSVASSSSNFQHFRPELFFSHLPMLQCLQHRIFVGDVGPGSLPARFTH